MSDCRDTCPCEHDRSAKPPIGSAACACGYPLLAVGAAVRYRGRELARVAGWARQDHYHVPVTLACGEHAIVARADLSEPA